MPIRTFNIYTASFDDESKTHLCLGGARIRTNRNYPTNMALLNASAVAVLCSRIELLLLLFKRIHTEPK